MRYPAMDHQLKNVKIPEIRLPYLSESSMRPTIFLNTLLSLWNQQEN